MRVDILYQTSEFLQKVSEAETQLKGRIRIQNIW